MNNFTYYLSANSGIGYTSFADEILNSFKKIIVLKNINQTNKQALFDKITDILNQKNIGFDTIIRSGTHDETDAVIINDLSTLISDENLFTCEVPLYADTVNFMGYTEPDYFLQKDFEVLKKQISAMKSRLFLHLRDAKTIHDEWEKIYISNTDFNILDEAADELCHKIFASCYGNLSSVNATNTNQFFGTLVPRGTSEYIDELTNDIKTRVFIKGRPGTGKSTVMKKLVSLAQSKGYNTESYFCSLDPASYDMVIVRDLDICVFDSTPPHEKFPQRAGDIVFDTYEIAVKSGTDELYADELMHISSRYNSEIKKAKECLYSLAILQQKYDKLLNSDEATVSECIHRVLSFASLT